MGRHRRGRLRDHDPQLRHARRVRPGRRAGARVRRVVDAFGRRADLDVQDPPRHEVVRRATGDVRGRALDDAVRPGRDEGRARPRGRLPRAVPDGRRRDGRHRSGPDDARRHLEPEQPAPAPVVHPDPAQARLVEARPEGRLEQLPEPGADRRHRPVPGRRIQAGAVRPAAAQRELLGPAGRRRPGRHHDVQERRHHDPGPQEGRARLRPRRPGRAMGRAEGQPRRPDRDRRRACPTRSTSSRSTATPSRSRVVGRRRRRSRTRPSGMRSAMPSTSRPSSPRRSTGTPRSAAPRSRRSRRAGMPSRTTSARSASTRPRPSSTRRATRSTPQANASTRTRSRSPSAWPGRAHPRRPRPPRSSSTGSASSGSRSMRPRRTRPSSAPSCCRPRPIRRARRTSTCSSGTGSAIRTRPRCSRS